MIADPADPEARYLANQYVHFREIPDRNIIYLGQDTIGYEELFNHQIEAVLGEIENRGLTASADLILIIAPAHHSVAASGLVTDDGCIGVSRFSLSSAFSTAIMGNLILAGDADEAFGFTSREPNGYFSETDPALPFTSRLGWKNGMPVEDLGAPRYLLAAVLGYTGIRGNTPAELAAMIERSVAADGSRPDGRFYFMRTDDEARSRPRDVFFADTIDAIEAVGGDAEQIEAVLPLGRDDCLGVLTGWPDPAVESADMTLLPGSFCDHLTSWAAAFDQPSQTKVSAWIRKGASGSHGAVEEPCADGGKFPHPRLHLYYYEGLSLAEAAYRSLRYVPFQTLLYGDPLTQPFAVIPEVAVPDFPTGPVSGPVSISPEVTTEHAGAEIARVKLYVDGVLVAVNPPGVPFQIDTAELIDGEHEIRIVAVDDSPLAFHGRWVSRLVTDNHDRWVALVVNPLQANIGEVLSLSIAAGGQRVAELRLLHNGRVVASTCELCSSLQIHRNAVGAGVVRLQAEAEFFDGSTARSASRLPDLDFGGACCVADGACLVVPESTCVEALGGNYLGDGTGCNAQPCPECGTGDFDGDAALDLRDAAAFLTCFAGEDNPPEDVPPGQRMACLCAFDDDDDGDVDVADFSPFAGRIRGPQPERVNTAPVAFDYIKHVSGHRPTIIEFPATDLDGDDLEYSVVTPPRQADVSGSGSSWVLRPSPTAVGTDSLRFRVEDSRGESDQGTITIRYPDAPPPHFEVEVRTIGEQHVPIAYEPADLDGVSQRVTPFRTRFTNDGSTLRLLAPEFVGVSPLQHWVINGERLGGRRIQVEVSLREDMFAVAAYLPCRPLAVRANRPSVFVNVFPADYNGLSGGVVPFDRAYVVGTPTVLLLAPGSAGGKPFRYWKLNGEPQAGGSALVLGEITGGHLAAAIYWDQPGDADDDGDFDLPDFAGLQACFSGDLEEPGFEPPSAECLELFDAAAPADGDVDLADVVLLMTSYTGSF